MQKSRRGQLLGLVVELFFNFNREQKRGKRRGGRTRSTPWASSHWSFGVDRISWLAPDISKSSGLWNMQKLILGHTWGKQIRTGCFLSYLCAMARAGSCLCLYLFPILSCIHHTDVPQGSRGLPGRFPSSVLHSKGPCSALALRASHEKPFKRGGRRGWPWSLGPWPCLPPRGCQAALLSFQDGQERAG